MHSIRSLQLCLYTAVFLLCAATPVRDVATPRMTVDDFRTQILMADRKPTVVMYMRPGCTACRGMKPTYMKLAKQYGAKMNFHLFDTDVNTAVMGHYQVAQLPTYQFFLDGDLKYQVGEHGGLPNDEPSLQFIIGKTLQDADARPPAPSTDANMPKNVATPTMTVSEFRNQLLLHTRGKPVIIMYTRPGCVACRGMKPSFMKLAQENGQKANFHLFDVEMNPDIMNQQNIRQLPTYQFFIDGNLVHEVGERGGLPNDEPSLQFMLKKTLEEAASRPAKQEHYEVKNVATPCMSVAEFRNQFLVSSRGKPVVIMYERPGCSACRGMKASYQKLANEFGDRINFHMWDTDMNPTVMAYQKVGQLPTYQFFLNAEVVHQVGEQGGLPNNEASLREMISRTLEEASAQQKGSEGDELVRQVAKQGMTVQQFQEEVLLGYGRKPVIIMYFARVCESCDLVRTAYYSLAKQFGDRAVFTEFDMDTNPEIVQHVRVTQLPTFQFYLLGKKIHEIGEPGGLPANDHSLTSVVKQTLGESRVMDLLLPAGLQSAVEEQASAETSKDDASLVQTGGPNACAVRREEHSGQTEKVVIIGGGPAGLTAGVYTSRAALCPLMIVPASGGQLESKGAEIENYPGVSRLTGEGLIDKMKDQAKGFNAEILDDKVMTLDLSSRPFKIHTNKTGTIRSESLIITTGANAKLLGTKGEWDYRGAGVSSCAICDGFLYRGKTCVVIGGGDAAAEDALLLTKICSKVYMMHRRDKLRATPVLTQQVLAEKKIEIVWDSEAEAFEGTKVPGIKEDGILTHIMIKNLKTKKVSKLVTDAAFVIIGHDPNTGMLKGQLEMEPSGHIKTRGKSTATSVPGVFVAGDVADAVYRQAITSAGTGAQAAIDAERWLNEQRVEVKLLQGTVSTTRVKRTPTGFLAPKEIELPGVPGEGNEDELFEL
eukprot:TRINITY_DN101050_c0_g1_i1.p1 TRINITY_DN101050_c0_g1~~TRINITY_DN101050_c0_g1_i1.p1  ORF type:complete len:938 (+),score=171.71 TRINITY_DN101050_c0_g1_i1:61-2874(+)